MNTSPTAFALCAVLSGHAQAEAADRPASKWFSIASVSIPQASGDMAAWTLAARTGQSGGVLQFGYATAVRDGLPAGHRLSIGYAWPLSARTVWYADAIDAGSAGRPRSFKIGVKRSW
jgi:hypothetical protein